MAKLSKNIQKMINFENILGLILSVLIIFEFKIEEDLRQYMNSLVGLVVCLVIVVALFMMCNPIVAILFLIYFYENVKFDNIGLNFYDKNTKQNAINSLSASHDKVKNEKDKVEIEVISKMAPIKKDAIVTKTPYKPYHCNKKINAYKFI